MVAETLFTRTLTETLQAFAAANLEDVGEYTLTEGDIREAVSHALSFDAVEQASHKLLEIFQRDLPAVPPSKYPVDPGAWGYVIRAVVETLVGNLETV